MATNQVCHIEWHVTDLSRARRFYEGMFSWTFQQFGEDMVVFGNGAEHIGGLVLRENVSTGLSPSVWIEVPSIDDYVNRAKSLGGSAERSKEPVPGVGWSAVVTDQDGNHVGLVQFERGAS